MLFYTSSSVTCVAALALGYVLQVSAQTEIQFFATHRTPHSVSVDAGPALVLLTNATTATCLNLADIFSNTTTTTTTNNATYHPPSPSPRESTWQGLRLHALSNITYLLPASGTAYDAREPYTQWFVNQYPITGNGSTPAPMQVNVYPQADCAHDGTFYLAHSCRESAGSQLAAGWSARSISLRPNDVDAGGCLYNATDGKAGEGSSDESVASVSEVSVLPVFVVTLVLALEAMI